MCSMRACPSQLNPPVHEKKKSKRKNPPHLRMRKKNPTQPTFCLHAVRGQSHDRPARDLEWSRRGAAGRSAPTRMASSSPPTAGLSLPRARLGRRGGACTALPHPRRPPPGRRAPLSRPPPLLVHVSVLNRQLYLIRLWLILSISSASSVLYCIQCSCHNIMTLILDVITLYDICFYVTSSLILLGGQFHTAQYLFVHHSKTHSYTSLPE